jgi:hypothetical protein
MVMNLLIPQQEGNLMTNGAIISFAMMTLFHGINCMNIKRQENGEQI